MELKVVHLVELLDYLGKEGVQEISLEKEDKIGRAGYVFKFQDKDSRECAITLFQAGLNISPDLVKKMKLYTRSGPKKKDHIGEALAEAKSKREKEEK